MLKLMKNGHFKSFCRLGPFSQVFGQFKAWIILNFADIGNFVLLILFRNFFMILASKNESFGLLKMLLLYIVIPF